ncbi:MAG TPA: universal stress protein [Acidimicrobiales bacterium]|nr:universal stress protein [Acidimicrobiales bacterium]
MYEILAAIDGSLASDRALEATVELARATGGHVHVVHVRELATVGAYGAVYRSEPEEAERLVQGYVERLRAAGVEADGAPRDATHPEVARDIVEAAREHDASVIVVGSRGRGDIGSIALGSVSHDLLRRADRPVLVVTARCARGPGDGQRSA